MKEIEKLIALTKKAHDVAIVASCDDSFIKDMEKAIADLEAMLKRAKVFEGKAIKMLEGRRIATPSFTIWSRSGAIPEGNVRIIVIKEEGNETKN